MVIIDGYAMDLLVSGDESLESAITEFPVEEGGNISDHVRPKPLALNLVCIVSNTPIGRAAAQRDAAVADAANVGAFGRALFGSGPTLPSEDAYAKLLAIRDETPARLVVVEIPAPGGGTRRFERMAIESLVRQLSLEASGGLMFTVRFRELVIIENVRTQVRTATPAGQGRGTRSGAAGKLGFDGRVWWRLGKPPGGPFEVVETSSGNSSTTSIKRWAYVERLERIAAAQDAAVAIALPGQKTPTQSLGKDGARYAYGDNNLGKAYGSLLSPAELNAFALDMARDHRAQQQAAAKELKSANGGAKPGADRIKKPAKGPTK